ncbi:beta transducin-like protein HET-D2Y [Colletotrichum truncatum]|uniref:Beta transducin-like protein HET-D2Y n=1 Tax=Colletotrichum truncatum TaxID=5467 RepID=A0ACC3YNR7_COLTU|nr:beta transducin-like protein HET-D2Y [Colletotrichum truncatum]KAF6781852.1 beta transducin-like protein HET-D2Y [Colletotrichum truncatum]
MGDNPKRPWPQKVFDLDERSRKRQATPDIVSQNDGSGAIHRAIQPNVRSELHGTGIQHSGSGNFSARDIYFGATSNGDCDFLQALYITDPRDDKSRIERVKGGLLRDSYRWILEHDDFRQWRDGGQSRLLWIKGDPGKGKTMLLCGIIDELEKSSRTMLSYFFCQATDVRLNNATAVLRGLIYQILIQEPSRIGRVREKYDHAGKKLVEDANSWDALSKMLFSILEDPSLRDTYLVIDALDECETNLDQLLHLIVKISSSSSSRAKLLISSRNIYHIENKIQPTETQKLLVLELKENAHHISWAVNTYIAQCVSELAQLQRDVVLQEQVRQKMQVKADGTFLWVALVIQELRKAQSWDILETIDDIPAGLEELYGRMIRQIQQLRRRSADFCRKILSTVTTTYRPLHLQELQALADLPVDISHLQHIATIVALCGSFLTIRDSIVYLVHQSAKDFLMLDRYLFPSGSAARHNDIVLQSIQVMSRILKRDVYDLRAPGYPIDEVEPPDPDPLAPARYSLVYWIYHLSDGNPAGQGHNYLQDSGPVHTFLEQHYLHWLEALSLVGSMSEGILQMAKLACLVQASGEALVFRNLTQDALRFIRTNKVGIESSPLQVYTSALIFCPKRSFVWSLFRHLEPQWVTIKPSVENNWNACQQTLEGHDSTVTSVAFSGDGTQLASASDDNTIKVWDSTTGRCLQTLEGHKDTVRSVAFSSASTKLVSRSRDRTVKIWDSATGQCLQTFGFHGDDVCSVACSGDGTKLGSALEDNTINIWDSTTSQCPWVLIGHSDIVWLMVFSVDSTRLASVSADNTIKVWDTTTGQHLQTIKGHKGTVASIAFSDDSIQLASASWDQTVKVWDSSTGQCLQTLEGHGDAVRSVAFSSDSTKLASGSHDRTIKIWDSATGQCLQTLQVHSMVRSVTFSRNNTQLASGSGDCTIRIWDIVPREISYAPESYYSRVESVVFSDKGTQLTSVSDDRNIQIWGRPNDRYLQTPEGHSSFVTSVAFSNDNTKLASGSGDHTIKIWDGATGQCLQTLEGHMNSVTSVTFSGDSSRLASGSNDNTVKIWDGTTGQCLQTLEGHSHSVCSVAFSVDDTKLASGSDDNTVKIWDGTTGQCLQTLEGHMNSVISVTFSGDSSRLASGSDDNTVKIWYSETGQCLQTLEGHDGDVDSVAFSSEGTQLASASSDQTVKIWYSATGQCLRTFDMFRTLYSLRFSETNEILHTDIGSIDLKNTFAISTTASVTGITMTECPRFCGYAISADGTWITRDSENLLWLPPVYRSRRSAVAGSTLVTGCASGHVQFFWFAEGDLGL